MSKLPLMARVLLGLIFFVFGLNGFFNFIPAPPMEGAAAQMMGGLMATGYFFPMLKVCEIVCGALLLMGAFVPLALVVLAPIMVNILMFHIFLAPSGIPMAAVMAVCMGYLAFFAHPYCDVVKQIFRCPMKESMGAKKVSHA